MQDLVARAQQGQAAAVARLISLVEDDHPAAPALLAFTLAMTALVAVAHRDNFRRMRTGAEPRASRLWLFARRGRGR